MASGPVVLLKNQHALSVDQLSSVNAFKNNASVVRGAGGKLKTNVGSDTGFGCKLIDIKTGYTTTTGGSRVPYRINCVLCPGATKSNCYAAQEGAV